MAASNNTDLRRARRFQVTPKAELSDGVSISKALIQDLSDSGMLLVSSKTFSPGQLLTVKLQTSPTAIIECTIEVRHSSEDGTGASIVNMSDAHRRAYERYLQELFSHQLGKLG